MFNFGVVQDVRVGFYNVQVTRVRTFRLLECVRSIRLFCRDSGMLSGSDVQCFF